MYVADDSMVLVVEVCKLALMLYDAIRIRVGELSQAAMMLMSMGDAQLDGEYLVWTEVHPGSFASLFAFLARRGELRLGKNVEHQPRSFFDLSSFARDLLEDSKLFSDPLGFEDAVDVLVKSYVGMAYEVDSRFLVDERYYFLVERPEIVDVAFAIAKRAIRAGKKVNIYMALGDDRPEDRCKAATLLTKAFVVVREGDWIIPIASHWDSAALAIQRAMFLDDPWTYIRGEVSQ